MDYVKTHARMRTLAPVFPIVLYNGDNPWRAPTTLAEPVDRSDLLGPYQVAFEYFKIAENELDRETLLTVSNIVSNLFLAEAHYDLSLLKTALLDIFDNESDKQAVNRDDDSGNPSSHVTLIGGANILATAGFSSVSPAVFTCTV